MIGLLIKHIFVMKQFFTRFSFFLLMISLSNVLSAQSILEITEPAEAAGVYNLGTAAFFAGCIEGDVVGEMLLADPLEACSPIITDVSGKIAVVDRGTCTFKTKALNAQDAGAIAVLICNNRPSSADGGGTFDPADDPDLAVDITIPTVFLSQEECNIFRTLLPLTGTIRIQDQVQSVLWGDQPGQGDFNGGLNGWTAFTIECNGAPSEYNLWQWSEDGTASRGSFADGTGSITSPSSCNGAMTFDSDFYDNNGDAVDPTTGDLIEIAFGSGPCPVDQIGELVSPIIDISGADASSVSVSFYQDARQFASSFLVGYSLDGGETWTDIPVNTNLEGNSRVEPAEVFQSIPLPGAAGSSNLRIRFRMEANYYYWIIDDVKIVEGFQNDLELADYFWTPASAIQPAAMVEHDPFLFQTQVINRGSDDQTDVQFFVEVQEISEDANGDLEFITVHADSAFYDLLPAGDTLVAEIDSLWNPDLDPGLYRIVYLITQAEEEENFDDNFEVAIFAVSENFLSKDLDNGNNRSRNFQTPGGAHAYANLYTIPAEVQEDFVLEQIEWRSSANPSDGPLAGNTINIYLLEATGELVESGFNTLDLGTTSITFDDQMEFKGFAEYTFPNENDDEGNPVQDGLFSTALEDFETGGSRIPLIPGNGYATITEYPEASGFIFQHYSTEINYQFLSSLLKYDRWFTGYAGENGFAPVISMALALSTSVDETPLPDGTMTLFPNPATDFVQAQFNFDNSIDATITLASIDGKVIEYKNQSLLNEVVQFNTSNLAEGMYLLRVATEIGTKTEKFVVKRP